MATSKSTKAPDPELTQTPGDASQYEGPNVSTGGQTPESVATPSITPDSLNPETPGTHKKIKDVESIKDKS